MKIAVVLLTWKRLKLLNYSLLQLRKQTFSEFDVFVSNANLAPSSRRTVEQIAKYYSNKGLRVNVRHDGNKLFAFRRFAIGRDLYEAGYDVVLFIDDDIKFSTKYIQQCIEQYEPRTYKSGFTWVFYNGGKDYYRFRKRVFSNDHPIHYAGTGISMIDASIFADPSLIDNAPEGSLHIEDVWLSFFVYHQPGWRVMYMETPGAAIGGSDAVALFRVVQKNEIDKAEYLRILVDMGWSLPKSLPGLD
jgi:glycosyltransferase involved in cell wall biosynthesis